MDVLIPWVLAGVVSIVAALAGAVSFLWRQNVKFQAAQIKSREARVILLEKMESEARQKIRALEARVGGLEKERAQLEARFLVFQSSHDSNPFPAWFKDLSGTMLACNKAYEHVFLRPRGHSLEDYVGHHDAAVWPPALAARFAENDLRVIESGEVLDTQEIFANEKGKEVPVRVVKYPRLLMGVSDPIGVAGIAILTDLTGAEFNAK